MSKGNRAECGLIPACAGKTEIIRTAFDFDRAHPRVCGENSVKGFYTWALSGSSPRVRGKLQIITRLRSARRLIPACAGKTRPGRTYSENPWAHPRVCGENAKVRTVIIRGLGSSPRVRGKRPGSPPGGLHRRLIPACAGKTKMSILTARQPRAHPRVCGENATSDAYLAPNGGSSPRVRGKPTHLRFADIQAWLIPACAGKT